METITLSYTIGQNTFSRSREVPDGSGARIVLEARTRLNLDPASTTAQVITALADFEFGVIVQRPVNRERQAASDAAAAGVADIPLT